MSISELKARVYHDVSCSFACASSYFFQLNLPYVSCKYTTTAVVGTSPGERTEKSENSLDVSVLLREATAP